MILEELFNLDLNKVIISCNSITKLSRIDTNIKSLVQHNAVSVLKKALCNFDEVSVFIPLVGACCAFVRIKESRDAFETVGFSENIVKLLRHFKSNPLLFCSMLENVLLIFSYGNDPLILRVIEICDIIMNELVVKSTNQSITLACLQLIVQIVNYEKKHSSLFRSKKLGQILLNSCECIFTSDARFDSVSIISNSIAALCHDEHNYAMIVGTEILETIGFFVSTSSSSDSSCFINLVERISSFDPTHSQKQFENRATLLSLILDMLNYHVDISDNFILHHCLHSIQYILCDSKISAVFENPFGGRIVNFFVKLSSNFIQFDNKTALKIISLIGLLVNNDIIIDVGLCGSLVLMFESTVKLNYFNCFKLVFQSITVLSLKSFECMTVFNESLTIFTALKELWTNNAMHEEIMSLILSICNFSNKKYRFESDLRIKTFEDFWPEHFEIECVKRLKNHHLFPSSFTTVTLWVVCIFYESLLIRSNSEIAHVVMSILKATKSNPSVVQATLSLVTSMISNVENRLIVIDKNIRVHILDVVKVNGITELTAQYLFKLIFRMCEQAQTECDFQNLLGPAVTEAICSLFCNQNYQLQSALFFLEALSGCTFNNYVNIQSIELIPHVIHKIISLLVTTRLGDFFHEVIVTTSLSLIFTFISSYKPISRVFGYDS